MPRGSRRASVAATPSLAATSREHLRLLGRTVDPRRFERALELRFVEVSADPFEVGLAALRAFVAREGHARVPSDHVEGDLRLGSWVISRRTEHRRGRLDPARVAELEALPGWTWDPYGDDWASGHRRPPRLCGPRGPRPGAAPATSRRGLRSAVGQPTAGPSIGRSPRSGPRRRARGAPRLDVGPVRGRLGRRPRRPPCLRRPRGARRVAAKHVEGGLRLGPWVRNRRATTGAGRLDPARVAELEALPGWTWDPYGDDWAAGLAALRAFVAREGHARVPQRHVEGGFRLGSWVTSRRVEHRRRPP